MTNLMIILAALGGFVIGALIVTGLILRYIANGIEDIARKR